MTDGQAAGAVQAVLDHYCESFGTLLGHLTSLLDCAQSQEAAARAGDFAALEGATARRREIMLDVAAIDAALQVARVHFATTPSPSVHVNASQRSTGSTAVPATLVREHRLARRTRAGRARRTPATAPGRTHTNSRWVGPVWPRIAASSLPRPTPPSSSIAGAEPPRIVRTRRLPSRQCGRPCA